MKIDIEFYKNFEIKVHYNEKTKFFFATSKIANSHNIYQSHLKNACHGFESPKEAVDDVKIRIDKFLETAPKDYQELADAITHSLKWVTETSCYVDPVILKQLVEAFTKK